ncbi:MAG: sulfite exporter TauE/SafE family protein [Candidatus Pacebacteria bacterium]|nr:sulfite exporter TauE/SafE family protein [Candidatus Paceibacterota bacterium]
MSVPEYLPIAACIFLLGMSKGGFPIGAVVLPTLILVWPTAIGPAKHAVAFMLPLLCTMDVVAVTLYRAHIQWRRVIHLVPGSLIGVLLGSIFFISDSHAFISVSDRALKIIIGSIGILFVVYRLGRHWLAAHIPHRETPRPAVNLGFGLTAGLTSTLAHAAGPVAQIYFLMQNLPKMQFAATIAGFFFGLNLLKLIPFVALGRLDLATLSLAAKMLPVVPLGVGAGYLIVRTMKGTWYLAFIHIILFITATTLIWKAITAG